MLRPDEVKAQIAGLLTAHPELRDDDEALVLSLESETDATVLCEKLARSAKETEAFAAALRNHIGELRTRRDRLDYKAEKLREGIVRIMEAAGINKLPTPTATLSVRYIPHVQVVERDQVPQQFRRHPPWEPMLELIKKDLKAGKPVSGCTLSNPEPSLTIRVK